MNKSQTKEENLKSIGKLFENYRRLNQDRLRQGYPQELKKKFMLLLKRGVSRAELGKITKISPSTLHTWIYQSEKEDINLPTPKELKLITDYSDLTKTTKIEEIIEKYCAKINMNNEISIELTEHGLLLSLNTLWGVK